MKVDAVLRGVALAGVGDWARRAEEIGVDGIFTTETNHDPFFPLVLAAPHTARAELGTGIALAFPRSPMTLAYQAWDLQALTGGRFVLGLGSQIKAHVVRRFSAEFSRPAKRMRELVLAVRAIWQAWETGEALDFRGDFYSHTLMPPAFRPEPLAGPPPKIFLAAVQEGMTAVAGEVSDGLMIHPLQTATYVRDTVRPALERGMALARRETDAVEVSLALFVVTDDEEREDVRERIAFYASTPAYRGVLEAEGYGELGDRLWELSRRGGWAEMPALVPDELLERVAVCASDPAAVKAAVEERYGGLVDRVTIHAGERFDLERFAPVLQALRGR